MQYNGKEVLTWEEFRYSPEQVGCYVAQEVVEDAINSVPPVCLRSDCTQIGEAYDSRFDEKIDKWRATYNTFKKITGSWNKGDEIWEYCGDCFRGENVQRGKPMVRC